MFILNLVAPLGRLGLYKTRHKAPNFITALYNICWFDLAGVLACRLIVARRRQIVAIVVLVS